MTYLALLIGLVLLAALYFSMKWERSQYEEIDKVMEESDENDIETVDREDGGLEEPGKLWEGKIRDVELKISRGWQREIFVVIEREFPFNARFESTNYLRSTTRFFKELFTPKMNVSTNEGADDLLAYATEIERAQEIVMAWSQPDLLEIIRQVHHIEIKDEEFLVMFYHPDIDLNELTDKATAVVRLYEALPDSLEITADPTVSEAVPGDGASGHTLESPSNT